MAVRGDHTALAAAAQRARPVALAREHVLPVLDALAPVLPDAGLRRGTVVAVGGAAATSLALAVAAAPSVAGSWVGAVGMPSLGLLAAAELGVALERLLLVAAPPPGEWTTVVATLIDGVDVVLVRLPRSVRTGEARRLQARARQRGAVLIAVGPAHPLEPDVTLAVEDEEWTGLDAGTGHLQGRRVGVVAVGRRAAARHRRLALWLPDADGRVRADEASVVPLPLRGAG
ncbi:MAG TPA: hypothetical protein VGF22_21755 [Acidimicrobiales bacterium]